MSTLADELLNDFEDSGSEGEEEQTQNGGLFPLDEDTKAGLLNPNAHKRNGTDGGMELDGDEEEVDEDEEMSGTNGAIIEDDEEVAKAKVEKMQLSNVNDVRSVAGLMKTLEPVLEVSTPLMFPHLPECKGLQLVVQQP